MNITTVLLD